MDGGRISKRVLLTKPHLLRTIDAPMDKFVINGGRTLNGSVAIGGAKNATLALMPATILAGGVSRLHNTPALRDVNTMSVLLRTMGIVAELNEHTLTIDTRGINKFEAPYEHVKRCGHRSTFSVLCWHVSDRPKSPFREGAHGDHDR